LLPVLLVATGWTATDSSTDSSANASVNVVAVDAEPAEEGDAAAGAGCACQQCGPCAECGGHSCGCDECSKCSDPCGCDDCSGGGEFFGPLAVLNAHPPTAIFLTPSPDVATVLPEGDSYLRLKLTHANHLIRELDSGVIADYDFETFRAALDYHFGAGGGEFSVLLPVTQRGHGFLDEIIADWHGWFGLPNGNRNKFPDYLYRYTIVSREGLVYNEEGDTFGVGDLSVGYKLPLYNHNSGESAMALRAGAKLPTGDPDKALGSGNFDFQLGALYQHQFGNRLRGYVNLDWIMVGEPDWDNAGYQDVLASLWALEYGLDKRTTAVAQYRIHRNPLQVGSFEADKDSQELALGFNRRIDDDLVWAWGFNEDLNPETAPDFVLYTDFKWEF
jgi:hypothetical protein